MSDAANDIAKDEERNRSIENYFEQIKKYLKDPTSKNLKKAIKAAEKTDSIPNGYFGAQTSLSKSAKKDLKKLRLWVECGVVKAS